MAHKNYYAALFAGVSALAMGLSIAKAEVTPNSQNEISLPVANSGGALNSQQEGQNGLEEIVVTAQKRKENIQKVPIAISSLSSGLLKESGATTTADLAALVPGLQVESSGPFAMASIRGIGVFQINAFGDPVVAYNVDGVVQDRSVAGTGSFYDVDRVEVLKGPQGTLYGRNATAGAINVVTNRPTSEFGGNLDLTVGNYSAVAAEGALNLPVSDIFLTRFAFQTNNHDGYFPDGYNDADTVAGRGEILLKPADDLSILIEADYFQDHSQGPADVALPFGNLNQNTSDPWDQHYYPQNGFTKNRFWGIQTQVDWDLGFATATVIPAFRRTVQDQAYYVAGTYTFVDNPVDQTSVEARLSHTGDNTEGSLSWVTGFYYFNLAQHDLSLYEVGCVACAADAITQYINTGSVVGRNLSQLDNTSYAGFAQGTYSINDWLRATAGIRYTHDLKNELGIILVNLPSIGVSFNSPDQGEKTSGNISWKLGLDADVTPDTLVYASASTGYKAGGLNEGLNSPGYEPEKLLAFALGVKNKFLNNRLRVNTEAFYWIYKNHQVATIAQVPPPGNLGYVGVNIPSSHIKGFDVDINYLVTPSDLLTLSTEYLDASTGPYTVPASGSTYHSDGGAVVSSPKWNITLAAQHYFDLPDGAQITPGLRFHYTSSQLLYPIANPNAYAGDEPTLDLDLTYNSAGGDWYVTGFIKNVTDEPVIASVFPGVIVGGPRGVFGPGPNDVTQWGYLGPPRTFGAKAGLKF